MARPSKRAYDSDFEYDDDIPRLVRAPRANKRPSMPTCPCCEEPVRKEPATSRRWRCPSCTAPFLWCAGCRRFSEMKRAWVFAHQATESVGVKHPVLDTDCVLDVEESDDEEFRTGVQRCHRLFGRGYSRGHGNYKGGDLVEMTVYPSHESADFLESALNDEVDVDDAGIRFKMWVTNEYRSACGFRVAGFWGPNLDRPITRAITAQRTWLTFDTVSTGCAVTLNLPSADPVKRRICTRDVAVCAHCEQGRVVRAGRDPAPPGEAAK